MSNKVEVNKKAVRILDGLVCVASTGIGLFWGLLAYEVPGAITGGIGGLLVAVAWCFLVRKMLFSGLDSLAIFVAAAILGVVAGMMDGALLHLICQTIGGKDDFIRAVNIGLTFGSISGLINGAIWGFCYGSVAYAAEARRKEGQLHA